MGTTEISDLRGVLKRIIDGAIEIYANFPSEKFYTSWSLGDPNTAITIAASASQASGPVDCTRLRRDHATIELILTGTGTAKVSAEASRDGVNDWVSLGDIITGKTVGNHVFALNDSNLYYSHFIRFTVTETGGANSVAAKLLLMARGG